MTKAACVLLVAGLLAGAQARAADFSSTGIIDGAQTTHLIVSNILTDNAPHSGSPVVLGAGYDTAAYRNLFSLANLSSIYSPSNAEVPYGFIDAATVGGGDIGLRPYNVYTLVVRGTGT